MVREKYGVRLTPEQRNQLEHLVRAGKSTVRVTTRARILLKTDEGWSAPRVAQALDVAEGTVFRTKRRFAETGFVWKKDAYTMFRFATLNQVEGLEERDSYCKR